MKLKPVQVIVDADPFRLELFLEQVRQEIFPNGSHGLNDDTFQDRDRSWSEILDLANTLPMLSPKRLLVIHAKTSQFKEQDQKAFFEYLKNPSPQTQLLVIFDKLDQRTKLAKTFIQSALLLPLPSPKPQELPAWLDRLADRHKVSFNADAKRLLAESTGPNLMALDHEIAKLSLFSYPSTRITKEAVETLVLRSSGDDIFAWTDQIMDGRSARALETLHHLLTSGSPALVLVSMLARHLRILLKAKEAQANSIPPKQLAPLLGVPPFFVQRYMDQARRSSQKGLENSLIELQKLDRDLKSTGLPQPLLLERTTRTIVQGVQQGR